MQDYYFSWGPCSPSLHRSCSLHRGVHSDCKFQLPLVPIYDNRNNVSYPSKRLNSFSKALLGFASFREIVGGKTGDYLSPRQGSPDPGKGLRPLHSLKSTLMGEAYRWRQVRRLTQKMINLIYPPKVLIRSINCY